MNGNERKAATRNHALALEQEIGRIHTPNVTTGHDTDFVNFIVVGKDIRWRGYPPMLSFSTAI